MENNQITMLQGPDRVRKRPAVLFGSDDIQGAQAAVRYLLEIFATQAQLGYCKHLQVRQNGEDLVISGDDRGLYLDGDAWQTLFCQLYAGPAYRPDESGYVFGLQDDTHHLLYGDPQAPSSICYPGNTGSFELCATQYATRYMDVQVVRSGVKSTLHFRQGHNIDGIRRESTQDDSGTCFAFAMDREVFTQTLIPADFFLETLQTLAMLCPGLCCSYHNVQTGVRESFSYPGGISDYVQSQASALPVYSHRLEARGKERYNRAEYEACVEVAIGYRPNKGQSLCLHNFRKLANGGTHYHMLQKQLQAAFAEYFEELPAAALCQHLTIVLATWCAPYCTAWENGTRQSIQNKLIADMVEDATARQLRDYVYTHKEQLRSLVEAALS